MKKIAIASDRAGLELKTYIIDELKGQYDFDDLGTNNQDPVDYPDYAIKVVDKILSGHSEFGILICGTGIGMSIAANRHKGIRAALCSDIYSVRLSRQHNNANVLAMGANIVALPIAKEMIKEWLKEEFEGGRHERRICKLDLD